MQNVFGGAKVFGAIQKSWNAVIERNVNNLFFLFLGVPEISGGCYNSMWGAGELLGCAHPPHHPLDPSLSHCLCICPYHEKTVIWLMNFDI